MTGGPRPDLTGQILDRRFRVERLLGKGGMGAVWRVQHVESLQALALKTIDPALAANPEAVDRFLREARAAGALRSRHVTRIVDAQTGYVHDGVPLPFLVMELLEGRTLQELLDLLDAGRLGAGQLMWVAGQLGRALAAAHERGIVHRDLKPSNVFIARDHENDGQPIVKLCDFGIAKLLGDAPALGSDAGLVTHLFRGEGINVLINEGFRFESRRGSFWIAGVDDHMVGKTDVRASLKGSFPDEMKLLLAHNPIIFREAARMNVDLTLSGHTHGGQIKLRDDEKRLLPRRRLKAGLHKRRNAQIYITRGIGTVVVPMRYQCPPEISLLELRTAE